ERSILTLLAEDVDALGVEFAVPDQLLQRLAGLERGVELDQRVGPEEASFHLLPHEAVDPLVMDGQEATDVVAVVGDDVVAQPEDVHVSSRSLPVRLTPGRARLARRGRAPAGSRCRRPSDVP